MPRLNVIERDWEKAIEIVERDYPEIPVGSPRFWAIVFGVVKRIRGRKSARHLDYLGILRETLGDEVYKELKRKLKERGKLRKARLEYLPYLVNPRRKPISISQLLMELPGEFGKVPPSALPSLPAARAQLYATANEILLSLGYINLADRVNALLSAYLSFPVFIKVSSSELSVLRTSGVISLDVRKSVVDSESWRLLWIYGMLNGKIPPPTRNWALFLTRLHDDEFEFLSNFVYNKLKEKPIRLKRDEIETKAVVGDQNDPIYLMVKPTVAFSHRFLYLRELPPDPSDLPEEQWEWLSNLLGGLEPAVLFYSIILSSENPRRLARNTIVFHPLRMTLDDFVCIVVADWKNAEDEDILPVIWDYSPEKGLELLTDEEIENFSSLIGGRLQPFFLGLTETTKEVPK